MPGMRMEEGGKKGKRKKKDGFKQRECQGGFQHKHGQGGRD